MQPSRRQTPSAQGVSPLAIVVPNPSQPRRRSSLLSAASPRTPRTSCGSPNCSSIFFAPNNRKSTDSWNSSNQDENEDFEWMPEQTLLLSRTLDALPAHLVTPFNSAVPPPNLLDKIARGVSQAKGPVEWPHSLRATRLKLLELARLRAKEEAAAVITEEDNVMGPDGDGDYGYEKSGDVLQQTTNTTNIRGIRRPLYRQSSMDFMNNTTTDNDNISRLSNRLQRADRIVPTTPIYHPYSRSRDQVSRNPTSSSPSALPNVPFFDPSNSSIPSLISPSTPSSSTLNSLSSISASAHPRVLRRSASTISSISSSSRSDFQPTNVQRLRRTDSCHPLFQSSSSKGFKRAPSFGVALVNNSSSTSSVSSDEEEKLRTKQAKKAKTRSGSPPLIPSTPTTKNNAKGKKLTITTTGTTACSGMVDSTKKKPVPVPVPAKPKRSLQRNPSIFGEELPHLRSTPLQLPTLALPPLITRQPCQQKSQRQHQSPPARSPPARSPPPLPTQPSSPAPRVKTLRRVRRLAPARKISFGSLVAPNEDDVDADAECGGHEETLGSAFQLR